MIYLFFIMPLAMAVAFIVRHQADHNVKETVYTTLIGVGLSCLIQAGAYAAFSLGSAADVEILNGYVTGKTREKVSCEHQYQCGQT